MEIKQFEDKNLSHFSYAVLSGGEIALVDPARNPQPYYDFAKQHNAKITAVIETHPHADFVSSHLEIHLHVGAVIYAGKLTEAEYPHRHFDDEDTVQAGQVLLKAINTPGHSPDSICIVAIDETGKEQAVFTGDTLFIGDCGRPDLREQAGNPATKRETLAKQLYHSLRTKLGGLSDDIVVYPAHGAGSLCGKLLSAKNCSTMGEERISNWSLQNITEEEFVNELLAEQPFIPKYFSFNVALNKKGAPPFNESISRALKYKAGRPFDFPKNSPITIIDTRPQEQFKKAHMPHAINLMNGAKFETWLGSIIHPNEAFCLIAENEMVLGDLTERTAKIGYESQLKGAFVSDGGNASTDVFNADALKDNPQAFTIIDVRNASETKHNKIFPNSINIPLHELRERVNEIPLDKAIVVHCAGGYRSAGGSSIIKAKVNGSQQVFDVGEAILEFQ
ncbi:MAG: MBL fold metallo-hydrolase [Candidatus Nephrothrix sp. EaCA]|nr:MAG: MBL fold metallo-hydrolase [Candidatus Nephrothrix sp. EaCA]